MGEEEDGDLEVMDLGDLEVMDLDGDLEVGEDTGDHLSPWEAGE